jgi:hypothetical protein
LATLLVRPSGAMKSATPYAAVAAVAAAAAACRRQLWERRRAR